MEWVYWIVTCICCVYFLVLLLEFNRPSQKLMEQIDAQEARRLEMQHRLVAATQSVAEMNSRLDSLTHQMGELEEARVAILPEANKRLMVFVPPGQFTMGGRDEDSPRNEQPAHTVYYPVIIWVKPLLPTRNIESLCNVLGTGRPSTGNGAHSPQGQASIPSPMLLGVMRVPTRRGGGLCCPQKPSGRKRREGGPDGRPYPWGGRFTEGERCNANGLIGTTTPVDEFPDGRSFYEAWDMAGNVYEWCADHYDEEYYRASPATNPPGPEGGQERTIRGGSYQETRAALRTTHRAGAAESVARDTIGFRVAMAATEHRAATDRPPPTRESGEGDKEPAANIEA